MKSAAFAIGAVLLIAFGIAPMLAHNLGPDDHQYEWDQSANQKAAQAQQEADDKRQFVAQQVCGNGVPEWLADGSLKCSTRTGWRKAL